MNCPRCKLSLSAEQYEGQSLHFCGNCWGHWVSLDAFERILRSEAYDFSTAEKATLLYRWSQNKDSNVDTTEKISCPACDQQLTRMAFDDQCPVPVDRCDEHGVWLDCSEIKQIQIFIDSLRQSE